MARGFEDIPSEIVEQIVVQLDVPDIGSLRLVSRTLAVKATQDHYKSFFRNVIRSGCKTVTEQHGPMWSSSEQQLTPEELAKSKEDLEVLRSRKADNEELHASGKFVELLAGVFSNLAANKSEPPKNLKLDINVYRDDAETNFAPAQGGGWKFIFQGAAQTLQATISALAKSHMPLEELDCFSEVQRCAVPYNTLSKINFEDRGLAASLKYVKAISITISKRIINEIEQEATRSGDPIDPIAWIEPPTPRDEKLLKAEAGDEANFTGVPNLLTLCPNVEKLDLHLFSMGNFRPSTIGYAQRAYLPACRWRDFLRETPRRPSSKPLAQRIRPADIHRPLSNQNARPPKPFLSTGTWRALFDHCSSVSPAMNFLFFDDLLELGHSHILLCFSGEEKMEPKFSSLCGTTGTNTLRRHGEEAVRKKIEYHVASERPYGSPQAWVWRKDRKKEYGPR